jgi:VIT1/CCC1 family predicted Fe2+/Mn2+ transporter
MKRAFKIGFSFGLPSGIVTTLGLIVGLNSITQSHLVVIGGILTIALADSFSDAMGIHFAQETENHLTHKDIWKSTLFTLLSKFIFSSIFIIPVLLFDLTTAIIISIMIGLYFIFLISLIIARDRNDNPWKVISEHILITILVILVTHYVGIFLSNFFGFQY